MQASGLSGSSLAAAEHWQQPLSIHNNNDTENDGDSSPETEKQPYLYTKGFPHDGSPASDAIVVFNMGLVHHLQEKSSTKVGFIAH